MIYLLLIQTVTHLISEANKNVNMFMYDRLTAKGHIHFGEFI